MPRLDTLDGLRETVAEYQDDLRNMEPIEVRELYCPRCTQNRKMKVVLLGVSGKGFHDTAQLLRKALVGWGVRRDDYAKEPAPIGASAQSSETLQQRRMRLLLEQGMAPGLFLYECVECDAIFTALIYKGPTGEELAVFPNVPGGVATRNTPASVAYYLDQAARSQASGARSAAVAMYRVALEQLLEHTGYKQRMLGPKVDALLKDVQNNAPNTPKWAHQLNSSYLTVIKDLGNGTLHTNGGDITLQQNATPQLLADIQLTFEELLELTIEAPLREAARLQRMSAAASAMTPKKGP